MKIRIGIASQTLHFIENGEEKIYRVSTSKYGAGERKGSLRTPRGLHVIRAKIGEGLPINTVFVGRRPTGEIYSKELAERFPERDWILTRILWLCGKTPGFNRFGEVDTMSRYIYIHGTPDKSEMGEPGSIGCIRMRNADLVELFGRFASGTQVEILEHS
ncbi:MAG: L,D-transpeptidase [Burkholderiales bacterium]|nr:L,D-transpeptidase [Burkholderiales bacterium]